MTKKKTSAIHQLLHTPISIPLFGILALVGTSFLSLNLSLFLQEPKKPAAVPSTITQNTLQSVLGTSISIGEKQLRNEEKQDPVTTYWQEVIVSKPEYRDAYIVLAINSFNKRNCVNTRYYLDRAQTADPDSLEVRNLTAQLKSCLQP